MILLFILSAVLWHVSDAKGNENTNAGREGSATPQGPILSDATLSILSAKNNVIKEVRFRDVFPISVYDKLDVLMNAFKKEWDDVEFVGVVIKFDRFGNQI